MWGVRLGSAMSVPYPEGYGSVGPTRRQADDVHEHVHEHEHVDEHEHVHVHVRVHGYVLKRQ